MCEEILQPGNKVTVGEKNPAFGGIFLWSGSGFLGRLPNPPDQQSNHQNWKERPNQEKPQQQNDS